MTITDRVQAQISTAVNQVFDKEPLNNIEVASLSGVIMGGRQNVASLALFYNHARDADLRALIKQSIDEETEWLVEHAEKVLQGSGGQLPDLHFIKRNLREAPLDFSDDARFNDQEIALNLAQMARTSQGAVLAAMHQTYQPYLARLYKDSLDAAFDYNYRLVQLLLRKGWLPHLEKVKH